MTGQYKRVYTEIMSNEMNVSIADSILGQINTYLEKNKKDSYEFAIGCEYGKHRSVATVEYLSRQIRGDIDIFHRDIDKVKSFRF